MVAMGPTHLALAPAVVPPWEYKELAPSSGFSSVDIHRVPFPVLLNVRNVGKSNLETPSDTCVLAGRSRGEMTGNRNVELS